MNVSYRIKVFLNSVFKKSCFFKVHSSRRAYCFENRINFIFTPWIERVGRVSIEIPRILSEWSCNNICWNVIFVWDPSKLQQFITGSHTELWFHLWISQDHSFVGWTAFVVKWGIPEQHLNLLKIIEMILEAPKITL